MRRLIALLVVWIGLLGAAGPAFACASSARDCCPPDAPAPCESQKTPDPGLASASVCCASVPAPSALASLESVRKTVADADSAPDVVAPLSGPIAASATHQTDPEEHLSFSPRTDASLTYLRIGRLLL